MRKDIPILVSILLCGFISAAPAKNLKLPARTVAPISQITTKHSPEIRVSLWQAPQLDSRGQIAYCANFAAIRALMAKASGSNYSIQNRALNVTFLLCMHGMSESD